MDKSLQKAWRREIHDLRTRKNNLDKQIDRQRSKEVAGSAEQRSLNALKEERDTITSRLEELKKSGSRLGYALEGDPRYKEKKQTTAPISIRWFGRGGSKRRARELSIRTTRELKVRVEALYVALSSYAPNSQETKAQELEAEIKGIKEELKIRGSSTVRYSTWRRWYKGPGKVRFWRGNP